MSNQMIEQIRRAHNIEPSYSHARQKPLYSTLSLKGHADPVTGFVAPQRLNWFASKVNTVGQGFSVPLHDGLTNFNGAANTMPSQELYVAKYFGLRLIARQAHRSPRQAIDHILSATCSLDIRRGDSTAHNLGAPEHWPCGALGASSRAIAALGAAPVGGAVTVYDFPTNGVTDLKQLDDGSEIVFRGGDLIDVGLNVREGFYLTQDGLPAQSPGDICELYLQCLFEGWNLSFVAG